MLSGEFVKALSDSDVLAADQLRALSSQVEKAGADGKDAQELATRLVRAQQLTRFQAAQVLAGKARALVLGDYVILDRIGAGGMGQVYKARHRRMNRVVAIKVLPPAALKDAQAVKRFGREVEAAAKLLHPNIVTAFDAGQANGQHYLVMEYVAGPDLATVVSDRGPLAPKMAVDYILQAARGLAFAHSKGIVHRDIKPANLLVDPDGVVKILDMGLARIDDPTSQSGAGLTLSGQIMGTVEFMAPEQAMDMRLADARSDIYSLGCTLYRLLTGENPYPGQSLMQINLAHREQPIPDLRAKRPTISPQLDVVFRRMIAKRPEERYQSMADVVAALEAIRAAGTADTHGASETVAWSSGNGANDDAQTGSPRGSLTKAVAAEKTKHLAAKVIGGSFATIIAPILVAYLLKYLDQPEAPASSPTPAVATTSAAADVASPATVKDSSASQPLAQRTQELARANLSDGLDTKGKRAGDVPRKSVAPFNAQDARMYQRNWAKHLDTTPEHLNSMKINMVLIPPGEFSMGSSRAQIAAWERPIDRKRAKAGETDGGSLSDETPQHRVTITRPFRLSAVEVTAGRFRQFVEATQYVTDAERFHAHGDKEGDKAGTGKGKMDWRHPGHEFSGDTPVTVVTWNDAVSFCNWLSHQEKFKPCYEKDAHGGWALVPSGDGYRLPTEAEWEYACRAGTDTLFSFGDDTAHLKEYAWYAENSEHRPQPVALKKVNAFGLHDMHGNVAEWCHDWFAPDVYTEAPRTDPLGPDTGSVHACRGGSFADPHGNFCRSAFRLNNPSGRNPHRGFRILCVSVLPGPEK